MRFSFQSKRTRISYNPILKIIPPSPSDFRVLKLVIEPFRFPSLLHYQDLYNTLFHKAKDLWHIFSQRHRVIWYWKVYLNTRNSLQVFDHHPMYIKSCCLVDLQLCRRYFCFRLRSSWKAISYPVYLFMFDVMKYVLDLTRVRRIGEQHEAKQMNQTERSNKGVTSFYR